MADQPASKNMLAKLFTWLFGEFGTSFAADVAAKKLLPNLAKEVMPRLSAHYLEKEKKFEESRGEFFGFLESLVAEGPEGQQAHENAFRRWRDRQHCRPRTYGNKAPYESRDEHVFEKLLVHLFRALGEETERKDRTQIFIRLFNLSDEQFDETLPLLEYDVVINGIRTAARFVKANYKDLDNYLNKPGGALERFDKRLVGFASRWGITL